MPPSKPSLVTSGSLGERLPSARQPDELVDTLAEAGGLRIERIVSTGQISAEDRWYDQTREEFVLVVAGAARLRIEGEAEDRSMQAGDWVILPAHCRHRVTWTQADPPTVWLAVHYETTGSDT